MQESPCSKSSSHSSSQEIPIFKILHTNNISPVEHPQVKKFVHAFVKHKDKIKIRLCIAPSDSTNHPPIRFKYQHGARYAILRPLPKFQNVINKDSQMNH